MYANCINCLQTIKDTETRYALLKCSAQSRLARFKLGKIRLTFFRGDFLKFIFFCFDLNVRENIMFDIFSP